MSEEEMRQAADAETARAECERLEREKKNLQTLLADRDAAITRLEQAVSGRDSELTTVKQSLAEVQNSLEETKSELSGAIAAYREMAVKTQPDIPAELINGETTEAVKKSLENARTLVEKVKQGLEAEAGKMRIPPGVPQRSPTDCSGLSAREKIQYAIGGKK